MLDIEKIRQLVDMMVANDLQEISLRDGDVEVSLRRPNYDANNGVVVSQGTAPMQIPAAAPGSAGIEPPSAAPKEDTGLVEIRSPMVGTFYAAPDPESPAFVQVGNDVHHEAVVCIVEAMKVFNEIKAEVDGTIEKILVKNEQAVEYGQPMFLVRPR